MNSQEISDKIYLWAKNHGFTAPYGVLQGKHTNKKGTRFHAITFGYARTLDATVEIYNHRFIILRTSSLGSEVFNDYVTLMIRLNEL